MVLAGEFTEGFANVLGGGGLLHAENFVVVLLCGSSHLSQSVNNLPSRCVFDQHRQILSGWRIYIYRNATNTGGRLCEDEPFPFFIGEVDKVRFVVDLEVQFTFPLPGVDVRKAGGNAVEGSPPRHSSRM